MFSTDFSAGLAVLAGLLTVFSVFCFIWAARLANYCRDAVYRVENENVKSLGLRRIAELEASMTELLDSHQALLDSHKKLRSRIGMRELREKRASEAEPTDLQSGDKRTVRLAAKSAGLI